MNNEENQCLTAEMAYKIALDHNNCIKFLLNKIEEAANKGKLFITTSLHKNAEEALIKLGYFVEFNENVMTIHWDKND